MDKAQETELKGLVARALQMTDERLSAPKPWDLFRSIKRQLEFIQDNLVHGRTLSNDDKRRITIGVLAAREFDANDPDYANVLYEVADRVDQA
jgi:hypothetical protein